MPERQTNTGDVVGCLLLVQFSPNTITLTEHCQPIFSTGVQCHWTNCPHEASVQPLQKPEEATTLWRFASLIFKTNTGLPDVTRTKTAGLSSDSIACSPSASIGVAGSIACRASLLWSSSCSMAWTISLSSCRCCHTVNNQGHVQHRAFLCHKHMVLSKSDIQAKTVSGPSLCFQVSREPQLKQQFYLSPSNDSGYSVVQDVVALEALHSIICRPHASCFWPKQPA